MIYLHVQVTGSSLFYCVLALSSRCEFIALVRRFRCCPYLMPFAVGCYYCNTDNNEILYV
jgi:hypothetical protein